MCRIQFFPSFWRKFNSSSISLHLLFPTEHVQSLFSWKRSLLSGLFSLTFATKILDFVWKISFFTFHLFGNTLHVYTLAPNFLSDFLWGLERFFISNIVFINDKNFPIACIFYNASTFRTKCYLIFLILRFPWNNTLSLWKTERRLKRSNRRKIVIRKSR